MGYTKNSNDAAKRKSAEEKTNFSKNCRESMLAARIIASGLSAMESTIGFSTGLMTWAVRASGSFSQSNRDPSASGVGIAVGSDM